MFRITKGDREFARELDEFFKDRYKHIPDGESIKLVSEECDDEKMQYIYMDELIDFLGCDERLRFKSVEEITFYVYDIIKPLIKKHKKKMECVMYAFNERFRYIKKRYVVIEKKNRQLIYHVMDDDESDTYCDKYKKNNY